MMLATRAEVGGHVWTDVGEPELWLLSKVLAVSEKAVRTEIIGNDFDDTTCEKRGEVLETLKILGYDQQQLDDWNDALRMHGELNEASLLQLLRRRFSSNVIYTFLGDVLISINPYKDVGSLTAANIPTPEELEEKEEAGSIVPHLHVVSERAHKKMLNHGPKGTPQSILINGESGSGKTEAAKCIMKCLAQRSFAKRQVLKKQASAGLNNSLKRMGVFGSSQLENRGLALLATKGRGRGANKISNVAAATVLDGSEDVEDAGSKVERSFLLANPLLEAFGNAKTVNNHNSSRFGKFVKIEYDDDGCIVGTNTKTFFLEKSRLVRRALGERNFHSFYQLLKAFKGQHDIFEDSSFAELDQFLDKVPGLLKASSQVDNRRGSNDDEDEDEEDDDHFNEEIASFDETNKAMDCMGIDEEERKKVWKMLALILIIGELEFGEKHVPDSKDNLVRSYVTKGLDTACQLLNIEPNVLELALCQRSVRAGKRGSVTYTPLTPERARASMEGLAKAMYNCLFGWLVDRVNESSSEATAYIERSRRKEPLFIGVLDIFGFEVLRTNSFEQLCINYANEMMQKFFDQHVFELEHHIYKEEGVDSSKFTFRDNSPIINLLGGKPSGIFRVLDEQGMMGDAATDTNFLQKIDTAHKSSTELYRARPSLHIDGQFEVKHFAGAVVYDVQEFIAKNKDILEADLVDLLTGLSTTAPEDSPARFVGQVFVASHGEKDSTASVFKQEVSNRRLVTLETVSGRFRSQMTDLSAVLDTTDQHFIRCVKPNKRKLADCWDAPLVLKQLKYLSVMEMVRIRTEGFPIRIPFPDMVSKFPELLWPTKFTWYPGTNDRRACETLMRSALGNDSERILWVSGTSKCFMRDGVLEKLMNLVRQRKNFGAIQMQKLVRGFLQRRRYQRQRQAAIAIQRWFRAYYKSKLPDKDQCAAAIQAIIRGRLARKEREKRMKAILTIQRFRRQLVRERRARRIKKIIKIQAWFRSIRCKRVFWHFRMNVVRLQARLRGVFVRGRFRRVLESREPWKDFLSPNEAIVLTSLVQKTSDVHGVRSITKAVGSLGGLLSSKKHRQLIFTTGPGANELDPQSSPRLFYVDPLSRTWKGEIPWDTALTCGLSLGDKEFLIYSKPNDDKKDKEPIWTFTDVLGPAVCWIRSIRRNVSVLDLVRDHQPVEFHTRVPPSHKGPLLMRQLNGPKKYLDLFFTLVGTDLWWIHTPGQTTPSGGVNLTGSCNVRIIENPRPLPGLPPYAFWLDTPCRAKPLKFRTNDSETMRTWFVAIERAIKKCRDDEITKSDPVALADRIFQSGCALFDASNFLGAKIKFKDALDLASAKGNKRVEAIQIQFDSLEFRSRCNFVLGLYEKALEDSTSALKLKPGNESCMRTRAASFEKLNRFQEGLDEYDKLIALVPWATDLPNLKERVTRSMEAMKGKQSTTQNILLRPKAPAIARQFSREFVREGSRSGLLAIPPVQDKSPTSAQKGAFTSFAPKRKMEEPNEGSRSTPPLSTGVMEKRKPPPSRRVSASNSVSSVDSLVITTSSPAVTRSGFSSSVTREERASTVGSVDSKAEVVRASLPVVMVEEDILAADEEEEQAELPPPPPPLVPAPVPPRSTTTSMPFTSPPIPPSRSSPSTSPVPGPPAAVRALTPPTVNRPVSPAQMSVAQPPTKKSPPIDGSVKKSDGSPSPSPLIFAAVGALKSGLEASEVKTAKPKAPIIAPNGSPISLNSTSAPVSPVDSPKGSPVTQSFKGMPSDAATLAPVASVGVASGSVAAGDNSEERKRKIKKRPSSGSGGLSFARAIADYSPSQETQKEDLTFKRGDEILVLHKFKDGWWKGSLNGAQGLFPSTFVQLINIKDVKGVEKS